MNRLVLLGLLLGIVSCSKYHIREADGSIVPVTFCYIKDSVLHYNKDKERHQVYIRNVKLVDCVGTRK